MFTRNKVAALAAEFLGTGVLALVIVSVQRSTIGVPYFVGLAAGLAAALLFLVFAKASGGQFNPALTIGLWTARKVKTLDAAAFVVVQLLGGYLAGLLYQYFIDSDLSAVSSTFTGRVLVAEAVGAAIFAMLVAAAVSHERSEGAKASLVGGGLAVGIIAASSASVGIINPAVALATNAWAWGTYVLGPVLGAVIGVNLYTLLFAPASKKSVAASTATASVAKKPKAATKKAPAKKKPAARKKK
ncbi:aquaporin [Candidatus Saccharibacteria bacterium]|nr:aquaporin [Candidatus Saccharibacteria bacterium]